MDWLVRPQARIERIRVTEFAAAPLVIAQLVRNGCLHAVPAQVIRVSNVYIFPHRC
jgi:hypothetical protein